VTPPLVSICVPTYQSARWIPAALESLLRQTYRNFEIHVLDDASTDDTADAVRPFEQRGVVYHRFGENAGGFDNMNRGLAHARGEFIAIYHADDVYDPTIVEREVDFLLAHPECELALAMDRWIDETGHVDGHTRATLPPTFVGGGVFDLTTVLRALMRHKNIFLRFPTFLARASAMREVGPFDQARFGIAADVDMYVRLLRRAPIGIIDSELMSYRHFPEQWSARERRLRVRRERFFDVIDHHLADPAVAALIEDTTWARYRYHLRVDETHRAANALILGRRDEAAAILGVRRAGRIRRSGTPREILREAATRALARAGSRGIAPGRVVAQALSWVLYRGTPSQMPAVEPEKERV